MKRMTYFEALYMKL